MIAASLVPLSATTTSAAPADRAATPSLRVVVSKSGVDVTGPTRFQAGWVRLTTVAHKTPGSMELVRFRRDYTFKDLQFDIAKTFAGGKNALKHLNRAIRHTKFYGAPAADPGKVTHGGAFLDRPDTYVLFQFGDNGPINPTRLHVRGPVVKRAAPESTATVVAHEDRRWGGDDVLPAQGAIRFVNRADYSPHFVSLQHVAKGTTRKEVIDCINDPACTFDFARAGSAETGSLSPGKAFTFGYSLPRGTYALMCFFPDPETGMPHAAMGMVRIVTLK
ncbi:hypothetical protein NLS1_22100 [Nocardioides sp. LS1]|nr:hypothetical protein NLS1_22100 [Nocardioides sp. LS1]